MKNFYSFVMLGNYGRLGNQMFQVAAIASLAKMKDADFALPPKETAIIRKCFEIPCVELTEDRLRLVTRRWEEPHFAYAGEIQNVPPMTDVLGYLQSWKYFADEEFIRKMFSFKQETIDRSKYLLPQVENIAIHVRRGDYLKHPNVFPLPTLEYYRKAISEIQKERPDAKPILFTDDPDWCKEHFKDIQIVSNDEETDMCMMSLCQHHVAANSSFSWWAAWLAKSDEQIVYVPKNWFGEQGPQDTQDLLPSWFRRI